MIYTLTIDNERIKTFEAQENLSPVQKRLLIQQFAYESLISPTGVDIKRARK